MTHPTTFIMMNCGSLTVQTWKVARSALPEAFYGCEEATWYTLPDGSGIIPATEKWDGKSVMAFCKAQPMTLDPYLCLFELKQ